MNEKPATDARASKSLGKSRRCRDETRKLQLERAILLTTLVDFWANGLGFANAGRCCVKANGTAIDKIKGLAVDMYDCTTAELGNPPHEFQNGECLFRVGGLRR